jgi:hypothetical protein
MSLFCSGKTKYGVSCRNKGVYHEDDRSFCRIHVTKIDELCTICMNKLFDVNMLCCGHMFHRRCIAKWTRYNSSCPICRCIVYDDAVCFKRSSDGASVRMDIRYSSR